MTPLEFVVLVVFGAVVFLDQWPAVQTMVSRPIAAGAVVGLVLDAPAEGVLWGAALEAMYLGVLPMGAARYPDVGVAAITGIAIALTGVEGGLYPAGAAVAMAISAGRLGEWVGRAQRRWNGDAAARVRERVAAGDLGAPGAAVATSLARGAGLGALQAAGTLAVGLAVLELFGDTPWVGRLPVRAVTASALAAAAVAGVRLFGRSEEPARGARAAACGAGIALGGAVAWWVAA